MTLNSWRNARQLAYERAQPHLMDRDGLTYRRYMGVVAFCTLRVGRNLKGLK